MPGNDFEKYKSKGYEYLESAPQSTQGINPESAFKEEITTQGDIALLSAEIKTSETFSDAIGTELHLKVLAKVADGLAVATVLPRALNHITEDSESIYLKRIENIIEPVGVSGSTIAALLGFHAVGAIGVAFFKVFANAGRYYALNAEMKAKKGLFRDYQNLCIDELVKTINRIASHEAIKESQNKQLVIELLGVIRNKFAGHPYRFDYKEGEKILTLAEIFERKTLALRSLNNQEINTALTNCRRIVNQRDKQIHAFNQIANTIDTHRGDVLTDIIDTIVFGVVPVIPIIVSYYGMTISLAPGFIAAAPIVLTVFAANAVLTVGGRLDKLMEEMTSRLWRYVRSGDAGQFENTLKVISYIPLLILGLVRTATITLKLISDLYLEPYQAIVTMMHGMNHWYKRMSTNQWERFVLKPIGLFVGGVFLIASSLVATGLWVPRVAYELVNTTAKSIYDILQTGLVTIKDGLRSLGSSDTPRESVTKKYTRCLQRVGKRFSALWNNIIKAPFTGTPGARRVEADIKAKKLELWDIVRDLWYGNKNSLHSEWDVELAQMIKDYELGDKNSNVTEIFKEQLARMKQYHVHISSTGRSKQADVVAAIAGILVDESENCNKLLLLHKLEFNEMDKNLYQISQNRSVLKRKVSQALFDMNDTRHAIKYEKWAKSELNSCYEQVLENVLEHLSDNDVLEVLEFKFNIIKQQLVKEQAHDENRLDIPLQERPEISEVPANVDHEYHRKFSQLTYRDRSKLIALKKTYDVILAYRNPIQSDSGLASAIQHMQTLNALCQRSEVASSTLETAETVRVIGYANKFLENKVSGYLVKHKKETMINAFLAQGTSWDLHQEAKKLGLGIESCKAILMHGYEVLIRATAKKPIDRAGLEHLVGIGFMNPNETSSENLEQYLKIPLDVRQKVFINCVKNGVEIFPLTVLSADSRQDLFLQKEAINQAVMTNNLSIVELHHIITDENAVKYRAFVANAYNALPKKQLIINLEANLHKHGINLEILLRVMQFLEISKEQKPDLIRKCLLHGDVDSIQVGNPHAIVKALKDIHEQDVTLSAEEVRDLINRYTVAINPNERRELNALASMNTNSRGFTTMYDGLIHQRKRAGTQDSIEDDPDISDAESTSPKNPRP